MTDQPVLFGRSSSHYTRLVRIFAHEAGVEMAFRPVYDLASREPQDYGGHPALKLPSLVLNGEPLFGALNICRALIAAGGDRVSAAWPEPSDPPLLQNANELAQHAMGAQVQLAFGLEVARLPADNVYFLKARQGLEGALSWLEDRWPQIEARTAPDQLSYLEASLFCLLEHTAFRRTAQPSGWPRLAAFAEAFGRRPSAQATPYGFDKPS
jgi:glutathione S-transferase